MDMVELSMATRGALWRKEFAQVAMNAQSASDMPPESEGKNRYTNVLPNPKTRVKLQKGNPLYPSAGYINANFIRGFKQQVAWIATQGPLVSTCDDFWQVKTRTAG